MAFQYGAYGNVNDQSVSSKVASKGQTAIVYVGTAPVHTVPGGEMNVNKPIAVHDMAEARKYFGYSDEWDKYTLCEAMLAHLEYKSVGPLVFINVLDPVTHVSDTETSVSLTPENGRVVVTNAQDAVIDSVSVKTGDGDTLKLNEDYTLAYDYKKQRMTIAEIASGALGTAALTISYKTIDAEAADEATLIGSTDGEGLNKGLYCIRNVYQETGYIPGYLLCPGFSSMPDVHNAMLNVASKVNGHWDVHIRTDIPIVDESGDAVTLGSASSWKRANGYTSPHETVYFPMAKGIDGHKYHLSVLAAAEFQAMLTANGSVPYMTPGNSDCNIIQSLYLGEDYEGRVYDDEIINEKLGAHGICSAVFRGGVWALWGMTSADYEWGESDDDASACEINRIMLYYLSNDFQHRHMGDTAKTMTANDVASIVAAEKERLDALIAVGALCYGDITLKTDTIAKSDVRSGKYSFTFNVTPTPKCRVLEVDVNKVDNGYETYFEEKVV